jgi:hypothetical protein
VEGPDVVRVGSAVVVEYPIGVEVERDDLRGILKFHAGIEDVGNQDRRRLVIWKELCPRISAEHLGTVDVSGPRVSFASGDQCESSSCLVAERLDA